jgi:hypothetical protein
MVSGIPHFDARLIAMPDEASTLVIRFFSVLFTQRQILCGACQI